MVVKTTFQLVEQEPLTAADPSGVYPFRLLAHVGKLGDVRDNGSASVSTKPGADCDIQGFQLGCVPDVEGQIRYRGRQPDGSWTDWVSGNGFAGSSGKSIPLVGFSVQINGPLAEQFDLLAVGAFSPGEDLVTVGNGQDCVPEQEGARLRGLQIIVRPKTSVHR